MVFDLDVDALWATFKLESFYCNEYEVERGIWTIYDDGVKVGSGVFQAYKGDGEASFSIDEGVAFDTIEFEATSYGAGARPALVRALL